jgi:hypothetical protein
MSPPVRSDETDLKRDLKPDDSLPRTHRRQRLKLPAEWRTEFGDRAGTVRFCRHFNKPTNLDSSESVFIVLTGFGGAGKASINGTQLGIIVADKPQAEFDITSHLQSGNQLALEIEFDPGSNVARPGGLWGPVVLEIRSPD